MTREARRRGTSQNQVVLDLLRSGLGLGGLATRLNGLQRLAGGWSAAELEEFNASVAMFERIDPELWD